jgi:hypothetical protein
VSWYERVAVEGAHTVGALDRGAVEARSERESPIALGLAFADVVGAFFGPDVKPEEIVETLQHRGCLRSEAERVAEIWCRITRGERR